MLQDYLKEQARKKAAEEKTKAGAPDSMPPAGDMTTDPATLTTIAKMAGVADTINKILPPAPANEAAMYLNDDAATIPPPHDDSEARELIEQFIEDFEYRPAANAWNAYTLTPEQAAEILANEPPAIIRICGQRTNSAGDLSEVFGAAKSRKTAYVTEIAHQLLKPHPDNVITSDIENISICFFDTEQSNLHAAKTYNRITKDLTPEQLSRLTYLRLRSESYSGRLEAITSCILTKRPELAIIDGLADLMRDTNSNTEAPQIIALIMAICEETGTHVKLIMHNSAANLGKGRGAAGSELGRKAESVEFVAKEKDSATTSIISPALTRNAPFSKIYVSHTATGDTMLTADYTPPTADDSTMSAAMLTEAAELFPTAGGWYKFDELKKAHAAARKKLGGGDPVSDTALRTELKLFIEEGYLRKETAKAKGAPTIYAAPDTMTTEDTEGNED